MKEKICKYDPVKEYYFEERCYINELANTCNDKDVSIAKARVSPGVTTRWHKLEGISERYVILQGRALVEIGDLKQSVKEFDVVVIPPGCKQRITNTQETDLVFLAVCTPAFTSGAYIDLQDLLIK